MKIPITAPFRQEMMDCRAAVQESMVQVRQANAGLENQIAALEAAALELAGRIQALAATSITSDDAASQLVPAERRASAIGQELQKLRAVLDATPGPSLLDHLAVIYKIAYHWRDALPQVFMEAVAPFGLQSQHAMPIIRASRAFQAVQNLEQTFSGPGLRLTPQNCDRLFKLIDRALRGQIDLSQDDESRPDAAPVQP